MIVYDFNTKKLYIPDGIGNDCGCGGECSPEQLNKAYQSGYTNGTEIGYADGYDKGLDDGAEQQKALLIETAITENGDYTREDGYSSINVNVPQTGHTDEELDEAWDNGYRVGFNDGADSVVCSGYTQEDLDAAFASGWSAGYVSGYTDGGGTDYYLKLDGTTLPGSYSFLPNVTSLTGTIESNTTWVISGCPVWIDASQLAGAGNANVVFSPNSNTDGWQVAPPPASLGWARQATCVLKTTDDSISINITFTQETNVDPFNPPTPSGYTNIPMGFEIQSDGVINWRCDTASNSKTIEYSKNGGAWISIASTSTGTPISVVAGDVVRFRGNNESYGPPSGDIYNTFSGSTAQFSVNGNIMSLINSTDFANLTTLTSMYTFKGLFCFCTGLTDASNLVLPATTLTADCYYRMFNGCTNLTGAPELPANTLTYNCYRMMFANCSSLTTAPQLPATTLSGNCYNEMFINCTSLERAPELPATELVQSCYYGMFWDCTNLNYIKCLATDISANNCTYNWVNSVSSTGTFVKAAGINWSTGDNGIPSGWTVEEE